MNGGGGGYTTTSKLSVSQADSIPVEIGAGAIGGSTHAGSNTSVSSVIANGARNSATIAYGPGPGTTYGGGNGGSGGGSVRSGLFYKDEGSNGGSDGSDGDASKWMWNSSTVYTPGGVGQGTTTRAFGESEGTLYAGGGGGCSSGTPLASNYIVGKGGAGGGGNGGAYSYLVLYVNPTDGGINTGGGAGGCCTTGEVNMRKPTAGSGIAIIRW